MTIVLRSDGSIHWDCSRCEVELGQHGDWLIPTPENYEQVVADERDHDWNWHTPAIFKRSRPAASEETDPTSK